MLEVHTCLPQCAGTLQPQAARPRVVRVLHACGVLAPVVPAPARLACYCCICSAAERYHAGCAERCFTARCVRNLIAVKPARVRSPSNGMRGARDASCLVQSARKQISPARQGQGHVGQRARFETLQPLRPPRARARRRASRCGSRRRTRCARSGGSTRQRRRTRF